MRTLAAIHQFLHRISRWAVWIGGFALMLTAVMVTADVLSRKFFNVTMSGSDEISGYVFAAATTWAYGYCLLHRSHIRIDALYNILPLFARAVLDVVGLSLLLLFMGYVTYMSVPVFLESWDRDSTAQTTLATPLWIPQLFWVSGLIFFLIVQVFLLLYAIVAFVLDGAVAVQALAGTISVQEEVEESTHGITELER